jgi:hypothetical protein
MLCDTHYHCIQIPFFWQTLASIVRCPAEALHISLQCRPIYCSDGVSSPRHGTLLVRLRMNACLVHPETDTNGNAGCPLYAGQLALSFQTSRTSWAGAHCDRETMSLIGNQILQIRIQGGEIGVICLPGFPSGQLSHLTLECTCCRYISIPGMKIQF